MRIFYLDILMCRTDKEFYTAFTSAVLKQSSSKFTIGPDPMRDFSISLELADKICHTVDNHSSYVQQLAWLIWIHTHENATENKQIYLADPVLKLWLKKELGL